MNENVTHITVLLVEPNQYPKVVDMEESLKAMQDMVGGYIEEYMPFEDDVAIICNEEGKVNGSLPNRAIYKENGELSDIVFGSFFLCYAHPDRECFESLPPELLKKYEEKFHRPERFRTDLSGKIVVEAFTPKPTKREAQRDR